MMLSPGTGWIGQPTTVNRQFVLGDRNETHETREFAMSHVSSDRWLSVDEIAEYLGVKRDTIYKWIDRKKMPAHKVGILWKFKRDEVDDWVRTGKAGASGGTSSPS